MACQKAANSCQKLPIDPVVTRLITDFGSFWQLLAAIGSYWPMKQGYRGTQQCTRDGGGRPAACGRRAAVLYGRVPLLYDIFGRHARTLQASLVRVLLSTVRGHVQAHSKAHATAAGGLQRAADERPCCIPGC